MFIAYIFILISAQTPVATAPSISPAEPIVVAPTGKLS